MAAFDPVEPLKEPLLLTNEQIEEISDWFDSKAKMNAMEMMVVTVEELQQFLSLKKFHKRSFKYPSYMDLMKEVEFLKADKIRQVTKNQMIYMLNKWVLFPDVKHELTLAFALFDTEKRGYMDLSELETIVTSYKTKLQNEEVIEFLRDCDVRGDGNIYYEDLIETFFSMAPELWNLLEKRYLYDDPNEDPSVEPDPEPEPEPVPPVPVPEPEVIPAPDGEPATAGALISEEAPLLEVAPEPEPAPPPPT